MDKVLKKLFIVVPLLFFCAIDVFAEETTTVDQNCNYNSQAYLNKVAGSVTTSYAFKEEADGSVSFDISIYNITDEIYVTIKEKDNTSSQPTTILYSMTNNGTYTFNVKDTTHIITYEIVVRTNRFGCTNDLRKLQIVKPKKNDISDMRVCKYEEVKDYYYCQPWITNEFSIGDNEIIDKVMREREKRMSTTTTKCLTCEIEEENARVKKQTNRIKTFAIIGLSLGIALDLGIMIMLIIRLRRSSL